jgi:hypothetical protein
LLLPLLLLLRQLSIIQLPLLIGTCTPSLLLLLLPSKRCSP